MKKENVISALVEGKVLAEIIKKIDEVTGNLFRIMWARTIPIDPNKIVFMTYSNSYMCNPKYIQSQLAKEKLPYDMVWICNKGAKNIEVNFPETVRVARRGTIEAFREMASARLWIDNSLNFLWNPIGKKKGQVYIETWHGSLGLKRAGKGDVKNQRWVRASRKCDKYTDICISNSKFEDFVYRDTHWHKAQIWQLGHARNDILLNEDERFQKEISEKVRSFFNLEETDKILLYAPTFRESGSTQAYNIDFARLRKTLEECYGGTWKILLRYHFHDRKKSVDSSEEYLIDATKYIDMQELLCVADIGISDYSSWLCDYILTRRPAFIYATDIAEYNTERGLYYPLETTPFPIATNNDELMDNIRNFNESEYEEKVKGFLEEKGCIDDGHAAERIVEKIKEIMDLKDQSDWRKQKWHL